MKLLRLLAVIVGIAITAIAQTPAQAQQKQPNIVVIWGDDIGFWNISAYSLGMMGYQTPNIDRIANEVRFSPTCMPSNRAPQAAPPLSLASLRSAQGF